MSKLSKNSPAGLAPHTHEAPEGFWFSVLARSQVHCPAGRARHEQRGPSTLFSAAALSQVQWRADCLPHEQVACLAVPQKKKSVYRTKRLKVFIQPREHVMGER